MPVAVERYDRIEVVGKEKNVGEKKGKREKRRREKINVKMENGVGKKSAG